MKSNILIAGAIIAGICAVGCGDSIMMADSVASMLSYTLLSIIMMAAALVLAGLGVDAENEKISAERCRKIHRVHSNEWRDAQ
jgi:hypothetical protein